MKIFKLFSIYLLYLVDIEYLNIIKLISKLNTHFDLRSYEEIYFNLEINPIYKINYINIIIKYINIIIKYNLEILYQINNKY